MTDANPDTGAVRLHVEAAEGAEGAVAHVTFDRPQARNAMTWAMYEQLGKICEQLKVDSSVRCVVFRGAGGEAFVAGTDIEQFKTFKSGEDGVAYERRIDEGVALIEALPMPTLAVIEGWCVGGGLAIANACDIRIGTPGSKFGVPIARTLGNCLSMANVARLVAAWGKVRVQRMLIAAELIGAVEAKACGWLAELVAAEQTSEIALQHAKRLASLAPVTQAVSKEALRRLNMHSLPDGEDLIRRAYGSADFREGVASFTEKRSPDWRGR